MAAALGEHEQSQRQRRERDADLDAWQRQPEQAQRSTQRHHQRECHGLQPHCRRAQLRPPQTHRNHRQHVIEPGNRMQQAGDEAGRGAALLVQEER